MTIVEALDCIIKGQLAEQEIRKDGLKAKDNEIERYRKLTVSLREKKVIIQEKIDEANIQLETLQNIKKQIQEESWSGVRK